MDFFTTHDSPVLIKIDGTEYKVPRFLMPALKEWSAVICRRILDEATEHLAPDDKARFIRFYGEPTMDISTMLSRATTPEGAEYVVETQLKRASVPDDKLKAILAQSDPILVRRLAEELTMAAATLSKLGVEVGDGPLTQPPDTSGGQQGIGAATTPDSAPSTT